MARTVCGRRAGTSKEQEQAARAAAMAAILDALADGPKTTHELLEIVGAAKGTLAKYLHDMRYTHQTIRFSGERKGRSELWTLGADPSLPDPDERLDKLFAQKRRFRPAKQIGMRRDPLVAALFGPATRNSGWNSIDTTVPDDETLVLLALDDGEVWPGYRDGDTWRDSGAMPLTEPRVTHWMHLPAAPQVARGAVA